MILCGVISIFVTILLLVWKKKLSPVLKKSLRLLLAGSVLGFLLSVNAWQSPVLVEGIRLWRNPVGEGDYEQKLIVQTEGVEKETEIVITVPEQRLTAAEEQDYLAAAKEEITAGFPGENESVDCVRSPVILQDTYQSGQVAAEWKFDREDVIDSQGNIVAASVSEEGVLLEATVSLTCGDSQCIYRFPFCVYPRILSRQEQFMETLQNLIAKEGEKKGLAYLTLPENVMDYPVRFLTEKDYLPEKVFFLSAFAALLLPAAEQNRQREQKKKKERELLLEYPDMVSKLALLLGAGMSLSGAWERIVSSYVNGKAEGRKEILPLYEEMHIAMHEMQSGAGEINAFQHFGERCGLQRYRRLSNMLVQNLTKGNRRLMEMLLQEAEAAFEERKSLAKKLGEEAGTKMLFPMLALLVVMMVILLIPAFMSFQM